ncbi:hypothetical protein HDC94_002344 [Leifsonia sp. AK011]|uniref:hypothetical protein n=1 Tax=Leifsonia sp. AK011 TaxID=2723075 RepID=UPI0015C765DF|nr:hypothetical protein [Leifsonia sp. AK011]NYF11188.1 hypothetical protein [Leifsonia sp. AK011]
MARITLPITFLDAYTHGVIDTDLVGEADDSVQALMRPLSETMSGFHVFVKVQGNEHPTALVADVTLEQLDEVRDILEADDRGRIRFDNAGRGGDPLPTLLELINVLGYISTPYALGKVAHSAWYELVYGRKQRAAQDWLRGGREDVLEPLRSWVRGHDAWREDQFQRMFGLNRDEAYRLLRAVGYEYRDRDGAWWINARED